MLNTITTAPENARQQQCDAITGTRYKSVNKTVRKIIFTVAAVAAASLNIGDMNLQEQLDFLLRRYK